MEAEAPPEAALPSAESSLEAGPSPAEAELSSVEVPLSAGAALPPAEPLAATETEPPLPARAAASPAPAAPRRRARTPRASDQPDPLADGRPAALRMASLHLRTGAYALARAELEALAWRGRLDEPALLDLAEVRWRTGDLAGAGDAARALLARGCETVLALVIAAEAIASAGRPGEARGLSARALELADGPLDALFAGMPRSMIWPVAATPELAAGARRRSDRRAAADEGGAPSTAAEAFAGGRAALGRGDASRAALLLGVALRLEPAFAEDVVQAVSGRDDQPMLALVRGDALRLLGREVEAIEAFDRARGRSSDRAGADGAGDSRGPGLFDDGDL